MVTAMAEASEPSDEQVTAFAGLILRVTGVTPQVAQGLAKAFIAGGARVDVAEQSDATDIAQITAAILADPPARLSEADIAREAHNERIARIKTAAAHSASQLIPSPSDHAMIDRLLEEL